MVNSPNEAVDRILSNTPGSVTLKLWQGKEREVTVERERMSAILARNGGRPPSIIPIALDAREAEIERTFGLIAGTHRLAHFYRALSGKPELYPGFEILVLRDPPQVMIGGAEEGLTSRAGARTGDVILSINGAPTTGKRTADLERLLSSHRPATMRLQIDRRGSVRTVEFRLAKSSELARQWLAARSGGLVPLWAAGHDLRCFLSPRDVMFARTMDLPTAVAGGLIEAHWMEDGNSFWFPVTGPFGATIYKYDQIAKSKAPLFDAARVRAALAPLIGHEPLPIS